MCQHRLSDFEDQDMSRIPLHGECKLKTWVEKIPCCLGSKKTKTKQKKTYFLIVCNSPLKFESTVKFFAINGRKNIIIYS